MKKTFILWLFVVLALACYFSLFVVLAWDRDNLVQRCQPYFQAAHTLRDSADIVTLHGCPKL